MKRSSLSLALALALAAFLPLPVSARDTNCNLASRRSASPPVNRPVNVTTIAKVDFLASLGRSPSFLITCYDICECYFYCSYQCRTDQHVAEGEEGVDRIARRSPVGVGNALIRMVGLR